MKVALVASTDWSLFNFRLPLALGLRNAGLEVLLVSAPGPYVRRLEELGFRHVPWNLKRSSLNPVSEAGAVLDLRRIYRAEQPDAVQHFTIKPIFHGSLAAASVGVSLVINTFTGVGFPYLDKPDNRLLRPVLSPILRKLLSRPGTHTVFYNSEDRDLLLSHSVVRTDNSSVIPGSGVDTRRFAPTEEGARPDRLITVVMAARLLWDKGVKEFVDAARILSRGDPAYRFVLAGHGGAGSRLCVPPEQLDAWQAESVVELPGHVEDMPALLAGADIAVLPSHHEGLPRFLLEAAATGLPLVGSDDPGCRRVIEDGVNGLVVPIRDASALAEAISALASDETLRRRMGLSGRSKAVTEFNLDVVVGAYLGLYQQLGVPTGWSGSAKTRAVSE